MISKVCPQCRKPFSASQRGSNFKRAKFCGNACAQLAKSFTPWQWYASFWSYVDRSGDCWIWKAGSDKWGYGDAHFMKRHIQAHRLAWMFLRGEPGKLDVLHKCNNPPCCNPDHLYLGTDADNARDRAAAGTSTRGERNSHAKLVESDVRELRRLRNTGMTYEALAERFGIVHSTAVGICQRRLWKHVE